MKGIIDTNLHLLIYLALLVGMVAVVIDWVINLNNIT